MRLLLAVACLLLALGLVLWRMPVRPGDELPANTSDRAAVAEATEATRRIHPEPVRGIVPPEVPGSRTTGLFLDLELRTPGSFGGVGARVVIESPLAEAPAKWTTDETGRATIAITDLVGEGPHATVLRLRFDHPHHLPVAATVVLEARLRVAARERDVTERLVLGLEPATRIVQGTVLLPPGAARQGSKERFGVALVAFDGTVPTVLLDEDMPLSSAEGKFTLRGLLDRRCAVVAWSTHGELRPETAVLEAGQRTTGIVLPMTDGAVAEGVLVHGLSGLSEAVLRFRLAQERFPEDAAPAIAPTRVVGLDEVDEYEEIEELESPRRAGSVETLVQSRRFRALAWRRDRFEYGELEHRPSRAGTFRLTGLCPGARYRLAEVAFDPGLFAFKNLRCPLPVRGMGEDFPAPVRGLRFAVEGALLLFTVSADPAVDLSGRQVTVQPGGATTLIGERNRVLLAAPYGGREGDVTLQVPGFLDATVRAAPGRWIDVVLEKK